MKKPVFGEVPPRRLARARRAAYLVVADELGRIAVVEGLKSRPRRYWLPGGGCESGESPQETVEREVAEELGRRVEEVHLLAEAVQVFYSEADECWFRSDMTFVRGRLGSRLETRPGPDPVWLDPARVAEAMYHSSHVWAVEQFLRL